MTRQQILTILIALLTTLTVSAAAHQKGVGCWRGIPKRNITAAARLSAARYATQPNPFIGEKRGLVILAEFPDMQFKAGHDQEKYYNILNTEGYTTTEGFRGSVADYFRDQSAGQFLLTFDVLGPFTTRDSCKYYGANDKDGDDMRAHEMIIEMCQAVDSLVDFTDYDWDGDGEVDEVFVVYAGKGEADGGNINTIWPHMWTLEDAMDKTITLDGVAINTYACANELTGLGKINGIGTFCHEFSHCLGFPDFYDTINGKQYGMGTFDVMDQGSYGGGGFCPPGYSAYEKMVCGWQMPIVLADEDVDVDSIQPMSDNGETYIIYNDDYPDEFYTIENRQAKGWDKSYPASGLLVIHVDYDPYLWEMNYPNAIITDRKAFKEYGYEYGNDHPRVTFFHANNRDISPKLYPYIKNDSLTATSTPAAKLYNENSLGKKVMMGSLLNIHKNDDGTMGFFYRAVNPGLVTAVNETRLSRPAGQAPSAIYSLDGRRVAEPLKKGIYIIDGRKVVR